MKSYESEENRMTREEALELIEGMTDDDLILFRDVILSMLHNPEPVPHPPLVDQEAN